MRAKLSSRQVKIEDVPACVNPESEGTGPAQMSAYAISLTQGFAVPLEQPSLRNAFSIGIVLLCRIEEGLFK